MGEPEEWIAALIWAYIFFIYLRYEYAKYLEKKKKKEALAAQIKLKDLKNMSKEQLDSMSYADRSRVLDEAIEKRREAPVFGSESIKARKEYNEVGKLLGVDHKYID